MSTDGRKVMDDVLGEAKALVETEVAQAEQLDLLDPVTPEDMVEAREALGPEAGRMSVLRAARERKKGRPPGARNKRTDDFARYLLQFGQHPAITMMQIQSSQPEVLIEASKQEKVHSFRKSGEPNVVIERMSYAEAQALRVRCAEGLLPYIESKKPIGVDMTFAGVADLVIEGLTHTTAEVHDLVNGDWTDVDADLPEVGE